MKHNSYKDIDAATFYYCSEEQKEEWRQQAWSDSNYVKNGTLRCSRVLGLPLPLLYWSRILDYPELFSNTLTYVIQYPEWREPLFDEISKAGRGLWAQFSDNDWNRLIDMSENNEQWRGHIIDYLHNIEHPLEYDIRLIRHFRSPNSFPVGFLNRLFTKKYRLSEEAASHIHAEMEAYLQSRIIPTQPILMQLQYMVYYQYVQQGGEYTNNEWLHHLLKASFLVEQERVKKKERGLVSTNNFSQIILEILTLNPSLSQPLEQVTTQALKDYAMIKDITPDLTSLNFLASYRMDCSENDEIPLNI